MLRALSLAVLTILAAPAQKPHAADRIILSQQPPQQQPPQTSPKRDCERSRDEGVSV